ncbi:MAG: hypothetical protein FJX72_21255, partial [Armatimonadetes bacterium]|nr:hypothetical protein [Armatimonadota bacterium]
MLVTIAATPPAVGSQVDVATWAIPLPEGVGLRWTDPREIHRVAVGFRGTAPPGLRLQYWSSRWPEQRLPRDREPGGGDVGWWELGNWHTGEWREADADVALNGPEATVTFGPVNRKEHPQLPRFAATWRFTHQIRLVAPDGSPPIESIAAFTASVWAKETVRIVWARKPASRPTLETFNGYVGAVRAPDERTCEADLLVASNADPNTFDRSLVTVRWGKRRFTFDVRDLRDGPVFMPSLGVAVTRADDMRTYAQMAVAAGTAPPRRTLYERIAELPEQTWQAAWSAMPPKKSDIVFPMGLDGGRQRFLLHPSGAVGYRINNHFIHVRPGRDTAPLKEDDDGVTVSFGMPDRPTSRTIEQGCLPICVSQWERDGIRYEQAAFVTDLAGTDPTRTPGGDAMAVCLLKLTASNTSPNTAQARLPVRCEQGPLSVDLSGTLTQGGRFRGQLVTDTLPNMDENGPVWSWDLGPNEVRTIVLKLPFVTALSESERRRLDGLAFEKELNAVSAYWRSRMDAGMRLTTPEPMLNDFHRAHLGHLLINCEKEPG